MRTEFVRIYKSVHTWTGIVSGLALFIAFYAGALTVFKEPLSRWSTSQASVRAVPLERAASLIARTLAARPQVAQGFVLRLAAGDDRSVAMTWEVRDPDADEEDAQAVRHHAAHLDAADDLRIEATRPSPLGPFIDTLHRVVGLPFDNDPSRWVMGVVAVLYAIALLSGVVVLLPTLVKDFFALRLGRNLKRMWLDAHNVVGIVSLPFHLVMALTAVVFAFHDGIYLVQDRLIHDGKWATAFQRPARGAEAAPRRDPATLLAPAELLARARALAPGFEPTELQYQAVTGPRATVRVWGRDAGAVSMRARGGFALLDPYSGRVLSTEALPGRQDPPNLLLASFFALHMASFGGTPVQWMYFLLGLAGAWLFYSGNLLWIESRRRRALGNAPVPVQRRDTRWMASATVGVCLGSLCGISLMIAASRWLQDRVDDPAVWHQGVYYAIFLACVAWAFGRGAARGVVPLLWCAGLATLAIPLTTLLAWTIPAWAPWAGFSPVAPGVDATAFAGALCLAWMARATARRTREGIEDSVWSAAGAPPEKTRPADADARGSGL
jgi:uncharacterized iron-regulated membrane protein